MATNFSVARLIALAALIASIALMVICCISSPVSRHFHFSATKFGDGGKLDLGMWGHCYTSAIGNRTCSSASIGYKYIPTGLPNFAPPVGTTPEQAFIVHKAISAFMIFYPLAAGVSFFALLLSMAPFRPFTLIALAFVFVAIAANVVAIGTSLTIFVESNTKLPFLFSPPTFAQPELGQCIWFALSALVAEAGSFIFLLLALEPSQISSHPSSAYQDMIFDDSRYSRHGIEKYPRNNASSIQRQSQRHSHVSTSRPRSRFNGEEVDERASRSSRYVAATSEIEPAAVKRNSSRLSRKSANGRLKAELEKDKEDSDYRTMSDGNDEGLNPSRRNSDRRKSAKSEVESA